MARHRSSAVPLAWLMAGLIVYASLYPFSGWRVPGGSLVSFLSMPWPRFWTAFDLTSNLAGYIPLGLLLYIAQVRSGSRALLAWSVALLTCGLLSFSLEVLQNLLPRRVPSNVDWALNSTGALLGASVGAVVHAAGGAQRWQTLRDRWFVGRSAGGVVLLLLWPVGLLFPLPLPLAMGHVLDRLQGVLIDWVAGTPASQWLAELAGDGSGLTVLGPGAEFSTIALGLLAPCLVAFAITHPGWRRAVLALGAAMLGFVTTTMSTALNFAPDHATAWLTPVARAAMLCALLVSLALAGLPRRAAAALGLMALAALVALVTQAPADPYFAESLQAWEQGRFIRFHGAAQWVGWVWPYAAMVYLLSQVVSRE